MIKNNFFCILLILTGMVSLCMGQTTPLVSIAATKMNSFYIGIDNPIKVAASGFESSKLSVKVSEGTITGSNGNYMVNVVKGNETIVEVSANGNVIGTEKFRIKSLPAPIIFIGAIREDGDIAKADLLNVNGITAKLLNFDFEVNYEVISFDLTVISKTQDGSNAVITLSSQSNLFSTPQKQVLEKLQAGQKLYIENVNYKGPDGIIKKVRGLNLMVI